MDINKVWLSGICVSQPIKTQLPSGTPFVSFSLQVNEEFFGKSGGARTNSNIITIETLGIGVNKVLQQVKQSARYFVEGYLRQFSDGSIRVRTFAVYRETTNDGVVYNESLKQTLDVLKRSRDLPAAIRTIEDLLDRGPRPSDSRRTHEPGISL
jgi:primosomal replication protein N